jgi:hypothetical protein
VQILRRAIRCIVMARGKMVPFVDRTFEWGVAIATFSSVLRVVPRHCARLTYFLHPKLRKSNAVLLTLKLMILTLAAPAVRGKGSRRVIQNRLLESSYWWLGKG